MLDTCKCAPVKSGVFICFCLYSVFKFTEIPSDPGTRRKCNFNESYCHHIEAWRVTRNLKPLPQSLRGAWSLLFLFVYQMHSPRQWTFSAFSSCISANLAASPKAVSGHHWLWLPIRSRFFQGRNHLATGKPLNWLAWDQVSSLNPVIHGMT